MAMYVVTLPWATFCATQFLTLPTLLGIPKRQYWNPMNSAYNNNLLLLTLYCILNRFCRIFHVFNSCSKEIRGVTQTIFRDLHWKYIEISRLSPTLSNVPT